MTPQQETAYASKLHELPPSELVAEYETQIEELADCPSSHLDCVRLARREIVRRLLS